MTDPMTPPDKAAPKGMVTDRDVERYRKLCDETDRQFGRPSKLVFVSDDLRNLLAAYERTLGLLERYATRDGIHRKGAYEHPYWCGYFPSKDGDKRDEARCDCGVKALREAGRNA